jgi:chromosome partitioning protein
MTEKSTVRVLQRAKATHITIANAKGGVGKTTLTTNLATQLSRIAPVGVLDLDPQASSSFWLQMRGYRDPQIVSLNSKEFHRGQATRSWLAHKVSQKVNYVICDTPAGLQSPKLDQLLKDTDILLIPVAPSQIDIHATAGFVKSLLLNPQYRAKPIRLGVVMNRVKRNTLSFQKLEKFLSSLNIPVVGMLRDTQNYIKAVEAGIGIGELKPMPDEDQKGWTQIIQWIRQIEKSRDVNSLERKHALKTIETGTTQLFDTQ